MWPLIIPPIVFVLCLGFLVWFLSKKSADPQIQERLALAGQQPRAKRFLFIFKAGTGLRILERFTQRMKLLSLKFHNRFQALADFLRRKRERANELKELALKNNPISFGEDDKEGFWDKWHRRHRATLDPVVKRDNATEADTSAEGEAVAVTQITPEPETPSRFGGLRKKVSALASGATDEYFTRAKRAPAPTRKLLSEEELIDRIAKNPKDAASYEELGDYYMASENLEDAKACYRQVIKLLPLNREVKDKVRKLERLLVLREKQRS